MTRAAELLRAWREKRGLNQSQAARVLKVTQACLSDYERGEKSPGVVRALEIERLTGKAVPVKSWAPLRTGTDD